MAWPGFDKFWTNVSRDLLPHGTATEALASYDDASGDLMVDYHLGRHVDDPAKVPDIFVLGPNGFQKPMKVTKLAAGSYRASIPIGSNEGLFRIRPALESKAFPEVGFYRQEAELLDFGSNSTLLKQIASGTGGIYFPSDNSGSVDLDRIIRIKRRRYGVPHRLHAAMAGIAGSRDTIELGRTGTPKVAWAD